MPTVSARQFEAVRSDDSGAVMPCPLTWIAIRLIDGDAEPVPGARYRVVTPDGAIHEGATGADGSAMIHGIPPGLCRVTFPEFDACYWQRA